MAAQIPPHRGLTGLSQGLNPFSVFAGSATLPVAAIPRARVIDDTRGVLKAVVDADSDLILGVSLLSPDSHEMINIVKTAMDAGLPYTVLRDQIFTHPTMSESLNDLFALIK